jgi:hypothetical protein
MGLDTLWIVADRARTRPRLAPKDISFVRDVAPDQFDAFPRLKVPLWGATCVSARWYSCGNVSGGLPNQQTHASCAGRWVTPFLYEAASSSSSSCFLCSAA